MKKHNISLSVAFVSIFAVLTACGSKPTYSPQVEESQSMIAARKLTGENGELLPNIMVLDEEGKPVSRETLDVVDPHRYVVFPEGCTGLGVPDPHHCDHFCVVNKDGTPFIPDFYRNVSLRSQPVNLLYLNFKGADLESSSYGDDPVEGKSSVVGMQGLSSVSIPPFEPEEYFDLRKLSTHEERIHTVAGFVRRFFAPYDIQVVVERPPDDIPYSMVMIGGNASDLNLYQGVLGVAPLDCGYYSNKNISFVFSAEMTDRRTLSSTIAHEAGHSFGLAHIANEEAVMNPYQSSNDPYWLDGNVPDGQACDGGSSQDSYELLGENLGWRIINGDPWVEFIYPSNGAVLSTLNMVIPQTADESVVEYLELSINGELVASAEWHELAMDFDDLGEGVHTLELLGKDHPDRNQATRVYSTTIEVTVDPLCSTNETCIDGNRAVGQTCVKASDCASGICVEEVATGIKVCSKTCSYENPCPWPIGTTDQDVRWTRCLCEAGDPTCCDPNTEDCGEEEDIDCSDPEWEDTEYCENDQLSPTRYCGIGTMPLSVERTKIKEAAGELKLDGCNMTAPGSASPLFFSFALLGLILLKRKHSKYPESS